MNSENTQSAGMRKNKGRIFAVMAIVILAGIILLAVTGWWAGLFGGDDKEIRSTFKVPEAGPLTISVTESGTIRSEERVVIKSQVEGRTTILSLVPEGTRVKEGDLLIELDASKLRDNLVEQQIRVQNSDASFIGARENLEVVRNQTKADISKAELDVRFAKEDLHMYKEGEYPKQVKELKSKIALAQEELQRARQTYEGSQVLYDEKYISQNELQADELAARKAELDLELRREELALVEQYTHQRRLDELEAEVEQTAMALDRVKRKASADVVQAEASLRAKEAELQQQKDKLAKNEEQLEKTRIYAPRDGLVVYATSTQFSWRGNTEPLDEGQEVRERQELIHLPANDKMMVQVKVPESKLQLIKPGLSARITIDALQGREFKGHVKRIAPLPNATSIFMNPDLKVYDTDVLIDTSDEALRTGMNSKVEIIAARYDSALHIPLHAVTRHGLQPVVYKKDEEGRFAPRVVQLGLDDNRLIHVKKGLEPGDEILLNPPMAGSEAAQSGTSGTEQDGGGENTKREVDIGQQKPGNKNSSTPGEQALKSKDGKRRNEQDKAVQNSRQTSPSPNPGRGSQ